MLIIIPEYTQLHYQFTELLLVDHSVLVSIYLLEDSVKGRKVPLVL